MAAPNMNHARAAEVAEVAKEIANQARTLFKHLDELTRHNGNLAIPWNDAAKPPFLEEDANGNLVGFRFSRQQLSNALGSLAAVQTTLAGAHIANIDLIADVKGQGY